jgi:hypothetical protein
MYVALGSNPGFSTTEVDSQSLTFLFKIAVDWDVGQWWVPSPALPNKLTLAEHGGSCL